MIDNIKAISVERLDLSLNTDYSFLKKNNLHVFFCLKIFIIFFFHPSHSVDESLLAFIHGRSTFSRLQFYIFKFFFKTIRPTITTFGVNHLYYKRNANYEMYCLTTNGTSRAQNMLNRPNLVCFCTCIERKINACL